VALVWQFDPKLPKSVLFRNPSPNVMVPVMSPFQCPYSTNYINVNAPKHTPYPSGDDMCGRSPEHPVRAEQRTIHIAPNQPFSNNKTTINVHHFLISSLITTPVNISTRKHEHAAFSLMWFTGMNNA